MSGGLPVDPFVLLGGALLAAGVLVAGFAARARVPGLLLFLALGMLLGDDGLAVVSFSDPTVAQNAAVLALVVILFEGGISTKPGDIRRAALPGGLLATVGVLVTAAVTAGGVLVLLDTDVVTALLIGAVVASTDAAAVFSVLRRTPLPPRLTSILEFESGANDPLAIVLTLGVLELWAGAADGTALALFVSVQLLGGLVAGAAVGTVGAAALRRVSLGSDTMYSVLALALASLSYGVAATFGASGFLAVYVTGLVIGARVSRHRRSIRTFHEALANTAEIGLFLMLGLLVFPSQLAPVTGPALAVTAVLVFLARPIAVLACLAPTRERWREMVLTSWAGLRGAVPIVLATLPLTAGYPQGGLIFNVVFFVVIVSTALQGSTVGWLTRRLGLHRDASPLAPIAEALPVDEAGIDLIEVAVSAQLPICGQQLSERPLPGGALVTAVMRNHRVIVPDGDTQFDDGDLVLVAVARDTHLETRDIVKWARGE